MSAQPAACRGAPQTPLASPGARQRLLLLVRPGGKPGQVELFDAFVVDGLGRLLRTPQRAGNDSLNALAAYGVLPGRSFTLLRAGRRAGAVRVDSINRNFAIGRAEPAAAAREVRLATDLPPDTGRALYRSATPAQRSSMRALLRDTLAAHQYVWNDASEHADLRVAVVELRGGRVALVGSYQLRQPNPDVWHLYMGALIIAEPDSSGAYRTAWSGVWRDEGGDDPYTPQLLDVVDADWDGVPEIVTLTDASTGSDRVSVFRRGAAGWREVIRSGC